MKTLEERFWSKVDKRGKDDCWPWFASTRKGYGMLGIGVGSQTSGAHRVSWELHNGPIPDELCVLHRCDNRPCVNPSHLFLGTNADNNADMINKNRQVYPPIKLGSANHRAKLLEEDVTQIRRAYNSGASQEKLAEQYNVHQVTISKIVLRQRWGHVK